MNEFNFRVANAAPRASGFEIGQNVGDTKTTYIYSYKTNQSLYKFQGHGKEKCSIIP